MKLKLNKKKLKNLSKDNKAIPAEMTALIGGANAKPADIAPQYALSNYFFKCDIH